MRLKSYVGPHLSEVMNRIRQELGPEALIISTLEEGTGVRVTAALEHEDIAPIQAPIKKSSVDLIETLIYLLEYHRLPTFLGEKLLLRFESLDKSILNKGITTVFHHLFRFNTLSPPTHPQTLMLIGPPGAGKTVTMGKLAAEAVIQNHSPVIVTLDSHKAGGIAQLQAYTEALQLPFYSAKSLDELDIMLKTHLKGCQVILDTTGINPFNSKDLNYISHMILLLKVAPIMVIPAGLDIYEALDMIHAVKELGVCRFIHTKVDLAHRLTTLLGILSQESLSLTYLSCGPFLGDRLIQPSGKVIGGLILEKTQHLQKKSLDMHPHTYAIGGNHS